LARAELGRLILVHSPDTSSSSSGQIYESTYRLIRVAGRTKRPACDPGCR